MRSVLPLPVQTVLIEIFSGEIFGRVRLQMKTSLNDMFGGESNHSYLVLLASRFIKPYFCASQIVPGPILGVSHTLLGLVF